MLYWFSWPTFSSSVICARRASIFFSVWGSVSAWAPARGTSASATRAAARIPFDLCMECLRGIRTVGPGGIVRRATEVARPDPPILQPPLYEWALPLDE